MVEEDGLSQRVLNDLYGGPGFLTVVLIWLLPPTPLRSSSFLSFCVSPVELT